MIEVNDYLINIELISIIITPIISLIAVIIYARALKISTNQNQIILSQSIKINFEKEINNLLNEGNDLSGLNNGNSEYKILNVFEGLFPLIRNLTNSEEFQFDRNAKIKINENNISSKKYYNDLLKVRSVIYSNSTSANYYKNIELFIRNVVFSKMIEEDKYSIKNDLRRNVLKKTLDYYKGYFKAIHLTEMLIPSYELKSNEVNWIKLNKSHLFNSMEQIIKTLEE